MALVKLQKDLESELQVLFHNLITLFVFFAFKEKNRSYDFKCGICMLMYEGVFKWDEFLRIFFFQLAVALRKDYFPLIEFLLMLGSVRRGKSLNTKENIAKFFTVF